jgi:peroxiredoxin Q/BCP
MTTLKIGDPAPKFSGVDQDGKSHQLADYKGKKLVVFFYPKANTPGCTAEASFGGATWSIRFRIKEYH